MADQIFYWLFFLTLMAGFWLVNGMLSTKFIDGAGVERLRRKSGEVCGRWRSDAKASKHGIPTRPELNMNIRKANLDLP
jgi:hypothetical protein